MHFLHGVWISIALLGEYMAGPPGDEITPGPSLLTAAYTLLAEALSTHIHIKRDTDKETMLSHCEHPTNPME